MTKAEKIRTTIYLAPGTAERLHSYCFHEARTITEVVEAALSEFIDRAEAKRGAPYPSRQGEVKGRQ